MNTFTDSKRQFVLNAKFNWQNMQLLHIGSYAFPVVLARQVKNKTYSTVNDNSGKAQNFVLFQFFYSNDSQTQYLFTMGLRLEAFES